MKRQALLVMVLSSPLLASAATNLLTNGSFESGLVGWTTTSTPSTYVPSVLTYGVGVAFGETVLPDAPGNSLSPDAAGTKGIYFVDDSAVQTLSQTFTVATAGNYLVGFSTYAPTNGLNNPNLSSFAAQLDSTSVLPTTAVTSLGAAQWKPTTSTVFLTAATHTLNFTFTSSGYTAKDLIVDRAFVTAVPEPETSALMLAGVAAVGFVARRRRG